MATLIAGSSGTERGYSEGSLAAVYGSLSPTDMGTGFTVYRLYTDTASANNVTLYTGSGSASAVTGKSLIVDGVSYTQSGFFDFGAYVLSNYSAPGFAFVNAGTYAVSLGSGGPTYAGPTYVGVSTGAGSATAASCNFSSSGRAAGDLLFVAVMTANQAVTVSGWTEVATYSPQSRGSAGVAGGVRLTLFSKVSDGTETTVTTSDSGDIQYIAGLVVRGAGGASVAIDIGAGNNVAATTLGSFGGVTTTVDDCLIAHFVATDRDAAAASWGTPTNANLANLAERFDNGVSTGSGGGIGIWTGEKQAAGATGNTTSTQAGSAAYCWITLALKNGSGAVSITPANAAHTHAASSPTLVAKSTVSPGNAASITAASSPTVGTPVAISPDSAAHILVASSPTIAAQSSVMPDNVAHVNEASSPGLATANSVTVDDAGHDTAASSPSIAAASDVQTNDVAHILASTSPTLSAASTASPVGSAHSTVSTIPSLAAVYPIAPDSTVHGVASTQPEVTLAGSIVPESASHDAVAISSIISAHSSVALDDTAHETAATEPSLSGSVSIVPASASHAHIAASPSLAWTGVVVANHAAHDIASTSPILSARAAIDPDGAAHEQSATSPPLATTTSIAPVSTVHIVVTGIPSVRITMSASARRTVATGYRDRGATTDERQRDAVTRSSRRNQVTAVRPRAATSVRSAR